MNSKVRKTSRKQQAITSILRNLTQSMSLMTPEEKTILKDYCTVKNLMNNPLVKLIAIQKPKLFIDYQVNQELERQTCTVFELEQQKILFINELASNVIHKFRNEILVIKKNKYVSFKNFQRQFQEFQILFD